MSRYFYPGVIYLAAAVVILIRGNGPIVVWPPSTLLLSGTLMVLASVWWSALAASAARPTWWHPPLAALPMTFPVATGALAMARGDDALVGGFALWLAYAIPVVVALMGVLAAAYRASDAHRKSA